MKISLSNAVIAATMNDIRLGWKFLKACFTSVIALPRDVLYCRLVKHGKIQP